MQATVSPTGQVSRTVLVALVLLAGLMLGGVGGYFINDLSRTVPRSASASPSQISAAGTDFALSPRGAAAKERAAAERATSEFALSPRGAAARSRAAAERAEANNSVSWTP